jgi:queuine/archaeosine tRNA-ribosyltransferase
MSVALENRATYVPAVGGGFWPGWQKNTRRDGHDLKWFSPHSFFRYPYALISAVYGIDNNLYWRHRCGYPKDCPLIGDSGGFQLVNNPDAIGPRASLKWQERNVDIGIALDVPTRKDGNFVGCLKRSIKNFEVFEQERENYQMKFYNVLQSGSTMAEMKIWYEATKSFDFDGWCLSVSSNEMQVLGYLLLDEKGEESLHGNFHLFGSTSTATMLTMAMLSKHFDTPITFDSTSYIGGSLQREFLRPKNTKDTIRFGRNKSTRLDVNPCHCPVCTHTTLDDLYSQTDPVTPLLLDLHNMYQFIEVNNEINNLVRRDDPEALESYAHSVGELATVRRVEIALDKYESDGLNSVLKYLISA